MKRWIEVRANVDEDTTWSYLADLDWLLSGYGCIFGKGCKGITGHADIGCCAEGVTSTGKEERKEINERALQLSPDEFEMYDVFHGKLESQAWEKKTKGFWNTFRVRKNGVEACVFANREGFKGGVGCAFHIAALNRGEDPIDWKPDACWQVPIEVETIEKRRLTIIRLMNEEDWYGGFRNGECFTHYWCAEDPNAWQNPEPFFRRCESELKLAIENDDAWEQIKAICEKEWANQPRNPSIEQDWVPVTLSVRYDEND
jgi:hypothetical protein